MLKIVQIHTAATTTIRICDSQERLHRFLITPAHKSSNCDQDCTFKVNPVIDFPLNCDKFSRCWLRVKWHECFQLFKPVWIRAWTCGGFLEQQQHLHVNRVTSSPLAPLLMFPPGRHPKINETGAVTIERRHKHHDDMHTHGGATRRK